MEIHSESTQPQSKYKLSSKGSLLLQSGNNIACIISRSGGAHGTERVSVDICFVQNFIKVHGSGRIMCTLPENKFNEFFQLEKGIVFTTSSMLEGYFGGISWLLPL